jgi:hypothetical protein
MLALGDCALCSEKLLSWDMDGQQSGVGMWEWDLHKSGL